MVTLQSIQDTLTSNNVPEIMLAVGGVIALLIVITYLKNKEGLLYKFMVLVGLVVGAVLILISVSMYSVWELSTTIIVIIAGFTLAIRPFREVEFAILLSLLVIAIMYVLLGNLAGGDFDFLASGWVRIIVAILVGILIYLVAHFIQAVVQLFGKLLNWWPLLFVLGVICIIEAVAVYEGYGSIYDYINGAFNIVSAVMV